MNATTRLWDRSRPAELCRYVQPDATWRMLAELGDLPNGRRLPANTGRDQHARVVDLYGCFADAKVRYAHEQPTGHDDLQWVRTPAEVLNRGKRGTCLDLAVTFAAACLKAGLHPLIVLTDGDGQTEAHALVAVWTRGDWRAIEPRYPVEHVVSDHHPGSPASDNSAEVGDGDAVLAELLAAGNRFVVLDPTAASTDDVRRPRSLDFEAAVADGRNHLDGLNGRGYRIIDVGLGWDPEEVIAIPEVNEKGRLRWPFREPDDDASIRLIRAEYRKVKFQDRQEYQALLAAARLETTGIKIVLLHGVGGAGKTRLAGEAVVELDRHGWYAGFFERGQPTEWMADEVSPLLLVVDYAESHDPVDLANLFRTLARRTGRKTAVVLTVRTLGAWWDGETGLAAELESALVSHSMLPIPLADRPERPELVYKAALRGFTNRPLELAAPAYEDRWTTLDVVLIAWLDVFGDGPRPNDRRELYERVLVHEAGYWHKMWKGANPHTDPPNPAAMRRLGALITLTNPMATTGAIAPLVAIAGLRDDPERVADMFIRALRDGSPTLAVRPDPIGDHLIVRSFSDSPPGGTDPAASALQGLDDDARVVALQNLNRAGRTDPEAAAAITERLINSIDGLWLPALSVGAAQGGAVLAGVERSIASEAVDVPTEELAIGLPLGHVTLRSLAAILAVRSVEQARSRGASDEELARLVGNLGSRLSEIGDRTGALEATEEATVIRRQLASANPAAFLPNLAASLSNLGIRYSDVGRRDAFDQIFDEVVAELPAASAKAELCADRAARLAVTHPVEAKALVYQALAHLQSADDDATLLLGRARRELHGALAAIRTAGATIPEEFPTWAASPIDEAHVGLLDAWAAAPDWAAEETLIRSNASILLADPFAVTLHQVMMLSPGLDVLDRCAGRLAVIRECGLDAALTQLAELYAGYDLVNAWIETPDWASSERFFAEHRDTVASDYIRQHLHAMGHSEVVLQHLSISLLADHLQTDEIYEIVTDVHSATDQVMAFIRRGQPELVQLVVLANHQALADQFYAPLAVGVLAAAAGDIEQAAEHIRVAAAAGEAHQIVATTAALRSCAQSDSDRAALWLNLASALTHS